MKNTKKNRAILKALNDGGCFSATGDVILTECWAIPDMQLERHGVCTESEANEIAIEIARRLNDYPNVVRADKRKRDKINILRAALGIIEMWDPAAAPDEPGGMSIMDAIEIARAARKAAKL